MAVSWCVTLENESPIVPWTMSVILIIFTHNYLLCGGTWLCYISL